MPTLALLRKGWRDRLEALVGSAERNLLIVAPFITESGVEIVKSSLSTKFKGQGKIEVLTCFDPLSICQGTCDPFAVKALLEEACTSTLTHLPRLHAKVYIADNRAAIITSGNLTEGGLVTNFEYGIALDEPIVIEQVRDDLIEYAALGAAFGDEQLTAFCEISQPLREAFRKRLSGVAKAARAEFNKRCRTVEEQLIRLRLAGGARHTVFAKTIVYLLKRYGPLKTIEQHPLIQAIHPDLCDDSIDRIIAGEHFGKQWKHAVRTAQQRLKGAGLIELGEDRRWILTPEGVDQ
jgi:hypothetical protein